MSTDTVENPLLHQEGLPKFASIEAEHLSPAVQVLLEQLATEFAALESNLSSLSSSSSYDQVVPVLERLQSGIEYAWGVAGHLNGVKNSDALRAAYEANQPEIVKATSVIQQSQVIYTALQNIQEQLPKDTSSFEVSQKRRAVEIALRSMTLGGVGLEGAAVDRFNEIKQRLAALKTTFSNNVLDATKAYHLTVTDATVLEGVPETAKALWAAAHVKAENVETTPESTAAGPWRITLDMPSYIAVQSHVRDRLVREAVYKAFVTRASELAKNSSNDANNNNVPLIYEILQLKHEMAVLLGFKNYAALSLASKMAPSVESVGELSDLIRNKALPAAVKELEEMTKLAQEQDSSVTTLEPWDIKFWTERLKESKFELTEEETRPYFALPAVLDGMFALVERLFQINVKAADGKAEIWHPDVRFFQVFDAENKHIASFYLDPYSRPENKRGGAWMGTCLGRSEACGRDVAVAYLTCNGSPPVGDKPSLMTFREVETLFHEFGHGLQHMLTTVTTGDVAGINGIEWDAVELPSQFMENWCVIALLLQSASAFMSFAITVLRLLVSCFDFDSTHDELLVWFYRCYDRPTVYGFAKHWETGDPMPEDMFEKLKEQKAFNAGMLACRQLLYGQLDMELHSNFHAVKGAVGEGESIFDVQRRVAEKYTPYGMPLPEDRFLCSFSHIFAGGYAAGYYSYKWAEVMSADAFSAFEDVGLDNEDEVKKVGMKFRETVLSLGGGVDPMTVFKNFRGREPSPEALLRHNELVF
jgi:oligopeptidase A